jgi:hypothetical protein
MCFNQSRFFSLEQFYFYFQKIYPDCFQRPDCLVLEASLLLPVFYFLFVSFFIVLGFDLRVSCLVGTLLLEPYPSCYGYFGDSASLFPWASLDCDPPVLLLLP